MKKILLCVVLIFITGISFGQSKWEKLGVTNTSTSYIDLNNIKKVGRNFRVWVLYDYLRPEMNGYFKYSSYIEYKEYECLEERSMILKQTMYSERMGEGLAKEVELKEKWDFVTPETVNDIILKKVCKK